MQSANIRSAAKWDFAAPRPPRAPLNLAGRNNGRNTRGVISSNVPSDRKPVVGGNPFGDVGEVCINHPALDFLDLDRTTEREPSTAQLEVAVEAFRSALQERTRDRVQLDWARTQNNLGSALLRLGELEGGTASLKVAVEAYQAALQEYPRDRVPVEWAAAQNHLGNAVLLLGEREGGTARLKEAVAGYRAALEERTRDRGPFEWSATNSNLGIALTALGERGNEKALKAAVAAFRAALEVLTPDSQPLEWAITQSRLAAMLARLGERESGTARLEEAVAAYSAVFEEGIDEVLPEPLRGFIQAGLNRAEQVLAERGRGVRSP
jgi:tetratricopeptide (TPR) repeat protein